jgi:hypothetical protein
MALTKHLGGTWGIVRGPQVLVLYLLGLLGVYIGERLIGGASEARYITSLTGVVFVLLACGIYTLSWLRSSGVAAATERCAALLSYGGLLALLLYVVQSDLIMGVPNLMASATTSVGLREVLNVVWPIVLVSSILPLLFIQWRVAVMDAGRLDLRRIYASAVAGATTAIFLATLFLINASAVRKDRTVDLSYFKTSSASDSSKALVEGLDADVEVLLFSPETNEVLDQVQPYFKELARHSDHVKLSVIDRALYPELAKLYRVSKDGTVILAQGGNRQKIEIGADLETARRNLRKLDGDFQINLLKLSRPRGVLYLVSGHGERTTEVQDGDNRARLVKLKSYLENRNYQVKTLSGVQGLAVRVPEDAALVMVIGPTGPLFPGELDAIQAYLERGGHLLLMLDPEAGVNVEPLLTFLGLSFVSTKLANDRAFGIITQTRADIYNLVTNRYSSHPAVSTVSRHSNLLPVVVPTAGYLEGIPNSKMKVDFLVGSLSDTWDDRDSDMQRSANEKRKVYQLAAAVSKKVATDAPDSSGNDKNQEKKSPQPTETAEMRAIVFADADIFSDDLWQFYGNQPLAADVIAWLIGEPSASAAPPSNEEDVPIAHTRGQDVFWFYGTVFLAPLLIVGIGLATRWGRGWKRRAGK